MLRGDYYALLMRAGFVPSIGKSDWRRDVQGKYAVARVWVSNIDRAFRAYSGQGVPMGHGSAPWELEALL